MFSYFSTEDLENLIQPIERKKPTIFEELLQEWLNLREDESDVWIDFDEFLFEKLQEKYIVEAQYKFIITSEIRNLLYEMQLRLHNFINKLKVIANQLYSFFSLLYGLCNSQSSNIFHSFFGCSLSRIPA